MKKIIKKRKRRLPDLWLPEILAVAFVLFLAHMTINHFTQEEHTIIPQNTERHEGTQKGNQSPQVGLSHGVRGVMTRTQFSGTEERYPCFA